MQSSELINIAPNLNELPTTAQELPPSGISADVVEHQQLLLVLAVSNSKQRRNCTRRLVLTLLSTRQFVCLREDTNQKLYYLNSWKKSASVTQRALEDWKRRVFCWNALSVLLVKSRRAIESCITYKLVVPHSLACGHNAFSKEELQQMTPKNCPLCREPFTLNPLNSNTTQEFQVVSQGAHDNSRTVVRGQHLVMRHRRRWSPYDHGWSMLPQLDNHDIRNWRHFHEATQTVYTEVPTTQSMNEAFKRKLGFLAAREGSTRVVLQQGADSDDNLRKTGLNRKALYDAIRGL
jgi:hypothetical protein